VNVVILAVAAMAAILHAYRPLLYYPMVLEDGITEWATFWAFLLAAATFLYAARLQNRDGGPVPVFFTAVACLCLFIAGEEISWGQRLLGYRPPLYFLERNFQQELNFHNIIAARMRRVGLLTVIFGYGVALPLLASVPLPGRWLKRLSIVAPPLAVAPSFLAMAVLYEVYPWEYTGEVVELMLGFGFLFAGIHGAKLFPGRVSARGEGSGILLYAASFAIVVMITASTLLLGRLLSRDDPEGAAAAQRETEYLGEDFRELKGLLKGRTPTQCNYHQRVYAYINAYEMDFLRSASFAARTAEQGIAGERTEFFLDPWNSPYWIRDWCDEEGVRRQIFVYSHGPNRRRDSSFWEILGDDVGAIIESTGEEQTRPAED